MLGKPAPTVPRPPVEVEPGPSCPPEIFNEFQMDVRDPGPGSAPRLQAWGQLIQDQAAGGWGRGHPGTPQTRGEKSNVLASKRLKFFSSIGGFGEGILTKRVIRVLPVR